MNSLQNSQPILAKKSPIFANVSPKLTGVLLPTGPFIFQPGKFILRNCLSKHVINPKEFVTPKI